jgi:uncharacterized membrane protein
MRLKIHRSDFQLLVTMGISLIIGGTAGGIWLNPLLWVLIVLGLIIVIFCVGVIFHDMREFDFDDWDRIIID